MDVFLTRTMNVFAYDLAGISNRHYSIVKTDKFSIHYMLRYNSEWSLSQWVTTLQCQVELIPKMTHAWLLIYSTLDDDNYVTSIFGF